MRKSRIFAALVIASVLGILAGQSAALAGTLPTGEVTVGKSTIEPAYDYSTGNLVYLLTPSGSAAHINPQFAHNVAPLYLVVYPNSDGAYSGPLNCEDTTSNPVQTENCPDHGPEVAMGAANADPSVYASFYDGNPADTVPNVRGHDHLVGIASTGGDFNVLWEPVLVLFNNAADAAQHVTTVAQISALGSALTMIPLPQLTFPCSVVGAGAYNHGTPVA